ncbi:fungal-specific transcription factor domain-containing protein [Biscogniauxia mediterranea]|nr:fungal-specific transcription factor domain-containing protein [Biscogniauxia mediterranea]
MSHTNADPLGGTTITPSSQGTDTTPPADASAAAAATPPTVPRNNNDVPKPKRLACMICRKRKLRCDGVKPSCSTCTRLGHSCAYDEVRKKSGPKRGYVKALEERLKQVEELLKTQEPNTTGASPDNTGKTPNVTFEPARPPTAAATANFHVTNPSIGMASDRDMDRWRFNDESPQAAGLDEFNFAGGMPMPMNGMDPSFTWEMIGLGLEEPLPPQETIDELHQMYFEKIHPSLPMIHKFRYLAAMNLAPNQRPPVSLRYAIWTLACSLTEKYGNLKDLFYQRARKYIEADYIKGYGEHLISVAHCQTHILLASYEFKMMYFPRAWMSTGSAVRLAQMMGLHRLDGTGLDVKQCLPPPRDWTEREERRRTFWMAFCQDRYASIGTGWPMTVDERDIMTNLPSSEEAFSMSRPEPSQTLNDSMSPAGAAKLSPFGGVVLMACLFGRNLIHLHRPDLEDRDHDMNGEFWKRHRNMDNILLNTSLCLPNHLKLPSGLGNPNIVFMNMNIHTSTICLHQAAIFKADRNRLPPTVSAESKVRCITAANEIASIMRMVSHMDLSAMNPFLSFCLYVAARVFVQYLKSRPDDGQTADSLRFLLAAMNALKKKNPLTESFLVQLDVDLEALGMRIPKLKSAFPRSTDSPGPRNNLPKMHKNPDGSYNQPRNAGLAYRDECMFTNKYSSNNGNPLNSPPDMAGAENPHGWYPRDVPREQRDCGTRGVMAPGVFDANGFVDNQSNGTNDMSSSSNPDGQSNKPTPNSSTSPDHRQQCTATAAGTGPGTGPMTNSSQTSFDTSPIAPHQNLGTQAEVDPAAAAAAAAAFFPSQGFNMSGAGMGMPPSRPFSMPDGSGQDFAIPNWETGQTGMTPGSTDNGGMLRNLMNLQMDAMDMGWDSTT